ncbi:hypothetical protein [Vibrio gallaecicus]|uniref:hypothetical protein n=1 Tax=Vibrio gallaecicus TaxID=552386 RepID=UPI0025B3BF77|nr:hypothetical protein [Vibrio gallaecicus]MDN3615389.1 hypothetical protein [Vibrio gallaecicus]
MRVRIAGQFCDSVLLGLACDSAFVTNRFLLLTLLLINYRLVKSGRVTGYILFPKLR